MGAARLEPDGPQRGGELHDIAFNPTAIDDHVTALEQAGLRVRAIREPRFSSA